MPAVPGENPQPTPPPTGKAPGTFRRFILLLHSNPVSAAGALLALLALLLLLTGFTLQSQGLWGGPYLGIVTVFILPVVLVASMAVVPIGLLIYRKQLQARLAALADRPLYLARAVVGVTIVNFIGVGMVGYAGVGYMSSVGFCGTACHSVMEPQYVAYQSSPHANVECVECHVGSGATWFLKSKLNGVHQLIGVLTDDHSRPVPTPVEQMRPASETCAHCHWPHKFLGNKLRVYPHYEEDEQNTESTNVVLLRCGGTAPDGKVWGAHWHAHPDTVVEYVHTDGKRMTIPWMRVKHPDGTEKVFTLENMDPDKPPKGELRRMDCIDCHNRAAHHFDSAPEAVDRAMAAGLISPKLPFIRKRALEALTHDWQPDEAADGIRRKLQDQKTQDGGSLDPQQQQEQQLDQQQQQLELLDAAAKELARIWKRNVYPRLNLGWDTYRSLNTHIGCMRCHGGRHRDREGRTLVSDCNACHLVNDQEILKSLGLDRKR